MSDINIGDQVTCYQDNPETTFTGVVTEKGVYTNPDGTEGDYVLVKPDTPPARKIEASDVTKTP